MNAESARRFESEAGVVAGIAEHHDQRPSARVRARDQLTHEVRADSLTLVLGRDRQRREADHVAVAEPATPAQNVTDDALLNASHELEPRRRRLSQPCGAHDCDLFFTVAAAGGERRADAFFDGVAIGGLRGPDCYARPDWSLSSISQA